MQVNRSASINPITIVARPTRWNKKIGGCHRTWYLPTGVVWGSIPRLTWYSLPMSISPCPGGDSLLRRVGCKITGSSPFQANWTCYFLAFQPAHQPMNVQCLGDHRRHLVWRLLWVYLRGIINTRWTQAWSKSSIRISPTGWGEIGSWTYTLQH